MKKRMITLLLVAVVVTTAIIAEAAIISKPSLRFYGTEANCYASVREKGKSITVTLSLWRGNVEIDSWYSSGQSVVTIQGICNVEYGVTYTLKLNGTINGVAFPEVSVSRTNWEMQK